MIQWMLTIWSLVPLPFLKPAWTSESSQFKCYWNLAWRIVSITLLACEMSAIVWSLSILWHLPFFGIGMKADLFQSCGHRWVFQICWHIECSSFTASSFRISNSSTGIPSPPLALFAMMLSPLDFTFQDAWWSDHTIVIIWVVKIFFLYTSLCILATSSKYLLLLLGPYHFCPLLSPSLQICSFGISNFFEEISSLSHSIVFLYFFTEEGFLISPCYSLKLCIQVGISFLSPLLFTSLLFTAICKASSDSHFAFLHFFSMGMVLIPVSCTMSQTSVYSSSGTLSDLVP